ncbi:hypothetical protein TSUD_25510 [Trifolium subterraneum]|uniref:Retrotransposon gag domain-containing protein n=1 Tax=Trifolium subterraneum TaxID=3900 RepID=A0A2Z6P226_TRISU|nr:hypothetical protein TSUD_25510 [Trifolium subterraneum]
MCGQNELICEHNRHIQTIENSRTTSRISRNTYHRRSPTTENHRSRSRSRSPRPAPRRNEERPLSPVKEHPRRYNRSPPPRNNRSPPPRNGEVVRREGNARPPRRRESPGSGDERHQGPLSRRIMDIPLPRGLEKPPSLDKASTRWRSLPPGSIDLWDELCRQFRAHFTTSKRHPKTVANLKAIIQGPEKPLRSYIERERNSKRLLESWKWQPSMNSSNLPSGTLNVKKNKRLREVRRPKNQGEAGLSTNRDDCRGEDKKRDGKVREAKPPKSQFTYYTPLNAPRDRILAEISSVEFKSAGIKFPKQLPAKPNVDKKNLCRFNKSYGHVTEDCLHLKDAIEILIQKGYARQYVEGQPRTENNPPRQPQLAIEASSPEQNIQEDNRVAGDVALAISKPEDFLPLPGNNEKDALDYLSAHLDGSWENFPGALVIFGGGFCRIIESVEEFDHERCTNDKRLYSVHTNSPSVYSASCE